MVAATAPPALAASSQPASAAALLQRPSLDVARLQREIQAAINSNEPGKAGKAARHIERCLYVERNGMQLREELDEKQRSAPDAGNREKLAGIEQLEASCQAVDAAARAQLVPLLRRSLAEGDTGAATSLMRALGSAYDPMTQPDIVAGLRRDAAACNLVAVAALSRIAEEHPDLLTPNEIGVLRELQRAEIRAIYNTAAVRSGLDERDKAMVDRMLDGLKPPPGSDAAEVARVVAERQTRCRAGS